MKKYTWIVGMIAAIGLMLASCNSFVDDFAADPNNPLEVPGELLLPTAQLTGQYAVGGQIARFTSIFMQQHAGVSRQEGATGRYQLNENMAQETWEEQLYSGALNDLYQLRLVADAEGSNYYSGIADVYSAYLLGLTTDLFGDVPWDECFQPTVTLTPAFQTQEQIYDRVAGLLTSGIQKLSQAAEGKTPGGDDLVYAGDAASWVKLANSILARQLLHLSKTGSYDEAAILAAASAGLSSNGENAMVNFDPALNGQNPMYQFDVNRNQDTRMGEFFVDLLNGLNDPRLPFCADTAAGGVYTGSPAGIEDESVSGLGDFYVSPAAPVALFIYPEIKFIEAEVHMRAGRAGDAAMAHNAGVAASLEFFGVDATAAQTYVDANGAEDAGSITMEKIMTQKYIALYQQPEVWFDWRRTGMPAIQPAQPNFTSNNIPRKFLIPETERLYNPNCASCGNETITDRVWWDQ
ncbi:MAG: SusD/RagB family nutrient-binding outer membrane lipoprotein [Bacteroidia bacterium]